MEARIDADAHHYYGMASAGKRCLDWNLNDWRWDGDLFIAKPLNPAPSAYLAQQFFPQENGIPTAGNSSNSSPSCSDEVNVGVDTGKRGLEKRRRFVVDKDVQLLKGRLRPGKVVAGRKLKLLGVLEIVQFVRWRTVELI
ncbi:hypothetical protein SAY87_030414 [Trapa incisa]|uniref:Uncharacterized protein n=1 Tax=Trapa incisa TaxID=236973 RepID=A0AAN7KVM0_9MYRT|nr:hypothetical protein SAY87_030414 [Trapa incisa]